MIVNIKIEQNSHNDKIIWLCVIFFGPYDDTLHCTHDFCNDPVLSFAQYHLLFFSLSTYPITFLHTLVCLCVCGSHLNRIPDDDPELCRFTLRLSEIGKGCAPIFYVFFVVSDYYHFDGYIINNNRYPISTHEKITFLLLLPWTRKKKAFDSYLWWHWYAGAGVHLLSHRFVACLTTI